MATRPSLQDLPNRGGDNKCPFLPRKMALTCPSLQDRAAGSNAFCLGPSDARGSCLYIQDVLGGSSSSNAGFDHTMPYGTLVDFFYNRDQLQVFPSAKASFLRSGKPCFCNSVGSSLVDWRETGNRSARNGSDSSCFLTSKAIKNRYAHCRKVKPGSKKRKNKEVSGTGRKNGSAEENSRPTLDRPTGRLSHRPLWHLFSPSVIRYSRLRQSLHIWAFFHRQSGAPQFRSAGN